MDTQNKSRSDDELVQLAANGENQAFEELVFRYKNALYQYLKALVQDEGAAGDLFQEVFLALFNHAADFKAQGKVKSWLFLTARNKAFNFLRDHKALTSLDQQDEEGNEIWHETLPDDSLPPLEQLTSCETAQRIRECINALPPAQRDVIYLRQYQSFKEIAQMLHKPLGTVLADGHRAIQKVRNSLTQGEIL